MTHNFKAERICLLTSTLCACGAIALIICSIIRSEWIHLVVHASAPKDESLWCSFTRHRGLMHECVEDSKAVSKIPGLRYGHCFELNLGHLQAPIPTSKNHDSIVYLRRVVLAMICSGGITCVMHLVMLFVTLGQLCKKHKMHSMFIKSRVVAVVLSAITFLFLICGIVVFHATLIAEMSQYAESIKCSWAVMSHDLQRHTSISYDLMYLLIWCAVALIALSLLLVIVSISFASRRCLQADNYGRFLPENQTGVIPSTSGYEETTGTLSSQVNILRETENSLRRTIY